MASRLKQSGQFKLSVFYRDAGRALQIVEVRFDWKRVTDTWIEASAFGHPCFEKQESSDLRWLRMKCRSAMREFLTASAAKAVR